VSERDMAHLERALPQVSDWEQLGERRYRGRLQVGHPPIGSWMYVAVDDERWVGMPAADDVVADPLIDVERFVFAALEDELAHEALPECAVPACGEKGEFGFTVIEPGQLAGQEWEKGAELRLCPAYGQDIYHTWGCPDREQLADRGHPA